MSSIFDHRSVQDIYQEIQDLYLRYTHPWVIGYSGGKDSSTVLQLVWNALAQLPPDQRQKPVYVIASDTKVETPVIVDYIDDILDHINKAAKKTGMPFSAQKVMPTLNDSYWVNLIGRGYPAPTSRFRWCTERLKINPADRFIQEKVTEHGEVIMVLSVRSAESSTRAQLMNSYQVKGHDTLRRHSSLPGAYVYAPIAAFTTDDVWSFLLQHRDSPWGTDNSQLLSMYRNANAGECPLVIDTSTPSCGNSRFGCWVCTVADSSMEAMIDNGQEWMEPLLDFRNWLNTTTNPERKLEFRDIKGRDGRVIYNKETGKFMARTYKLDVSREMLKRVLEVQRDVRRDGPEPDATLISEEEIHEIRRLWRTERQDWEDSVPDIYRAVTGDDLDWLMDDNTSFDADHKELLTSICEECDVPFDLIARLLEEERKAHGMARRSGIQKGIASVLKREWRSADEIIEDAESDQLPLL